MAAQASTPSNLDAQKPEPASHVESRDPELQKGAGILIEEVDQFGSHKKTDPVEIALVKKLDWYIMVCPALNRCLLFPDLILSQPMLWFAYMMNFLDRNAIVNARLNGLVEELELKGNQYNTCSKYPAACQQRRGCRTLADRFLKSAFYLWGISSDKFPATCP